MRRIAITGGIGSGKSIVSSVLRLMGFFVYDCDSEAKRIMNTSTSLKNKLCQEFGNDAVVDGKINRPYISSIVFNDRGALSRLNSIVHPFVFSDFDEWSKNKGISFVETAILYESGMDKLVDEIWVVDAPVGVRVRRVMKRNNLAEEEVLARINSQSLIYEDVSGKVVRIIQNDDKTSILSQLMKLTQGLQ